MRSRFMQIYLLQIFYCLPIALGWTFALLFYTRLGFTAGQISVYYLLHYLTVLAVLLFFKRHRTFNLIMLAFIGMATGFFVMSRLSGETLFYLIAVIIGATSGLFWVPYNTTYFSFKRGDNTAVHSGLLFLAVSVLNTVIPIASGVIIDSLGFESLFIASVLLALVALTYAIKIRDKSVLDLELGKTIKPAKGVRTLVFLEGFWQGIAWISIPLITFRFLNSGLEYGSFLSYLGLAGAIAVLLLCRMSDKRGNRLVFIIPITFLAAVSSITAGFTETFIGWTVINGLISFFIALTSPFTVSVILDRIKDVKNAIVVREFMLNIGRICGVIILMVSLRLFNSLHYALIAAGLAFMLYPIVLKAKKLYPGKISLRSILSGEAYEFSES